MKLRNKKTGAIYSIEDIDLGNNADGIWLGMTKYNSLAELNEEWEDCEEPKEHWCVTMYGGITRIKDDEEPIDDLIEIGNYFNSKEDAYDAWGKLKAWKRLQDKGFRFILDEETEMPMFIYSGANGEKCITNAEESKQCRSDIKLLFGGEE